MPEQINIRSLDQWYIDKLNDLTERTGMARAKVARELVMAAIERCYPDEEPIIDIDSDHEDLMNIYHNSTAP